MISAKDAKARKNINICNKEQKKKKNSHNDNATTDLFQLILCSVRKWCVPRIPRLDKVNVNYLQCEIHKSSLATRFLNPYFLTMVFSTSFGVQSNEISSLQFSVWMATLLGKMYWISTTKITVRIAPAFVSTISNELIEHMIEHMINLLGACS